MLNLLEDAKKVIDISIIPILIDFELILDTYGFTVYPT